MNPCEIVFEKGTYSPGESITGKVVCNFSSQCKARDITIRFSGRAKVSWNEGKVTHTTREDFLNMESSLLRCETDFEPGRYEYPFTFNLPCSLPSSMEATYGSVKYKARANVDKEWALDYGSEKVFNVYSCSYLNSMGGASSPLDYFKDKVPLSLGAEGRIRLAVNLSQDCYAPNQMVPFIATVKNASSTTVNELRFKIEQGFTFHVGKKLRKETVKETQEFAVIDSVVKPHKENFWNLELRIPADMFIGLLTNCSCIKVFWILKGEVCLPFPHKNMHLEVPLLLGSDTQPRGSF